MWISLYFLAVVGGLLPVASPSTNGLASSSFMAETTRWVSLKGLQLLELVKVKERNWERDSFMAFGSDIASLTIFWVFGGGLRSESNGPTFRLKSSVEPTNRLSFYKKNDSLYLYFKGASGDTLKICVISSNTDLSVVTGIDPTVDSNYELITLE